MKINITYATILGTSQGLAEDLEDELSATHDVSVTDIMHLALDDLYDGSFYVFISSTTGRGELPDTATDFVEDLNDAKPDLSALNFAIFGLGDQGSYGDNFCDAAGELYDCFSAQGATMVGLTATDDYDYSDSKALRDGKFCGLLCDEDNEYDKSEGRANDWVEQLKGEGVAF